MSAVAVEALLDRTTPGPRLERPVVEPTRTRPRRPGPGVGPVARPRRLRFVAPPRRPSACRDDVVVALPTRRPSSWRLTERGMTLVLLVGAALVAASVVVVGLTALRVTGDTYRPTHSVAAPVVVEP